MMNILIHDEWRSEESEERERERERESTWSWDTDGLLPQLRQCCRLVIRWKQYHLAFLLLYFFPFFKSVADCDAQL
jgi:hypothetical protein